MSFVVTTTVNKPANTVWFKQANPAASSRLDNWFKGLAGVVGVSTVDVDSNTMIITVTYTDQAAATAVNNLLGSNADWQAKVAHRQANNQKATHTRAGS